MLKLFIFLKFLLLGSCTYQYTDEHNVDIEDIKKIKLNVKSFEISNNTKMIDFPLVAYDSKNYHVHLDRLYNL